MREFEDTDDSSSESDEDTDTIAEWGYNDWNGGYGDTDMDQSSSSESDEDTDKIVKWGYNDWNGWRQEQGMLCRTDNDCWMDSNLACERNDFDFVLNRNWFGGDWNSIIGQCECRFGQWDHTQLQCQAFGGAGGFFAGVVGILVILLMIGCFGCCCIGIACWFCRRQSA